MAHFVDTVYALDYYLPMFESIGHEAQVLNSHEETAGKLLAIAAQADFMPFKNNSMNAIIASSVIHEIASFGDDHKFGNAVNMFFREANRVLIPGSRLIIRDFQLPPNADKPIFLEIGRTQSNTEMNPAIFLMSFMKAYQGKNIPTMHTRMKSQTLDSLKPGVRFEIPLKEALEIIVHYSWSARLEDEAKEQYFYLPQNDYAKRIVSIFQEKGSEATVIHNSLHLQDGYPEHINGRFNLYQKNGKPLAIPGFTGITVVEKSKHNA